MNVEHNSIASDADSYAELTKGNYWFIKLRWLAIIGIVLSLFVAKHFFRISLSIFPLFTVAVFLATYNYLFFVFLRRLAGKDPAIYYNTLNKAANAQISLDLLSLVMLIHYSGGIENPFIFYFIFHMIIASILLSRMAAYLQATFASFLFCLMIGLEYAGFLNHYHLVGFTVDNLAHNGVYVAGVSCIFISTLYIAVYMATFVSSQLHEKEKSLEEANELLMTKDRIKGEYVLRVTHGVKEHLAAIQSCIEPVTRGITGSLNEKQMNLLQRADERTGKLLLFVKALLEITRIRLSADIKMEPFSLRDMISDCITTISSRIGDKRISFHHHIDSGIDSIQGAREYLQETLVNILANSVKYTPKNGKIDLQVLDQDETIRIEIKDTGIGIPSKELSKIFEEFFRASNARKIERDGTGMGLSIAKQVVEKHHGKIWVNSEENKGTSITILLPK